MYRWGIIFVTALLLDLVLAELSFSSGTWITLVVLTVVLSRVSWSTDNLYNTILGIILLTILHGLLFQYNIGLVISSFGGVLVINALVGKVLSRGVFKQFVFSLVFFNFFIIGLLIFGMVPELGWYFSFTLLNSFFASLMYLLMERFGKNRDSSLYV